MDVLGFALVALGVMLPIATSAIRPRIRDRNSTDPPDRDSVIVHSNTITSKSRRGAADFTVYINGKSMRIIVLEDNAKLWFYDRDTGKSLSCDSCPFVIPVACIIRQSA